MLAMLPELRLLLVDEHALFREGLTLLLEREPGLRVVGSCDTMEAALAALGREAVDLLLLDHDLGTGRAVDLIGEARRQGFAGRFLVVTAGVAAHEAVRLVQAGVAGIFHKHNPLESLKECVWQIARGDVWLERDYLRPLLQSIDPAPPPPRARLTERDRAALRALVDGLSNKEIGERLAVSEAAVKASLQQLFQKLGVRTRSQLVRIALQQYQNELQLTATAGRR